MPNTNLSAWALKHQQFILFSIIILLVGGIYSYTHLGQEEDPGFTVRSMVVQAYWPGATIDQMQEQVTDKLEKKLQSVGEIDFVKSYVQAGQTQLTVTLRDDTPPERVPEVWYQVRKKIGDIAYSLPQGVRGPFFNDEFGTTFGNIYALTADGFDYAQMKDFAEAARDGLLRVPDVDQVNLIGTQDQRIYIEYSNAKLSTLGINPDQIVATLKMVNGVQPAGIVQTRAEEIQLQVSGDFDSVQSIRNIGIYANDRMFRLGDVATVKRGYVDPPQLKMFFNGQPAIGLAISMRTGGDVLRLGKQLSATVARLEGDFPVGVKLNTVSDQPKVVKSAVGEFSDSLYEAVGIVLLVCFLSLGLRTGFVVALCIPFVLAVVFLVMYLLGIDLQRISLGALIIALGLLVDDAIISVEMMVLKLEEGWDHVRAATFAYTATAFPMLTGTLITVAGFLPVAISKSGSAEYTRSLFEVVGIALVVSWFVAVLVTPYLGFELLPDFKPRAGQDADIYQRPFYRWFRRRVELVPGSPRAGDRRDRAAVRRFTGVVPVHPAAVLSFFRPARAGGGPVVAAIGQFRRDRKAGVGDATGLAQRPRHRVGDQLRRRRQPAFLSAAERADAKQPVGTRGHDQGLRTTRSGAGPDPAVARSRIPCGARPRDPAGERATRRLSGAVPRQRRGREAAGDARRQSDGDRARQPACAWRQHGLGRTGQGPARGYRPGQGEGVGGEFQQRRRRRCRPRSAATTSPSTSRTPTASACMRGFRPRSAPTSTTSRT